MGIGPVEYLVVGFPGNKFSGELAPALAKLVDDKVVRVLDLIFIGKDLDGTTLTFEVDQLEQEISFEMVDGEFGGMISDDDVAHAAESLEPGTSAALLIWEDLWAAPFADALRRADAVILEGGRVPHELAQAVMDSLAAGD